MDIDPKLRQTWTNHTGNQSTQPLRVYEPRSTDEVIAIVQEAESQDCTVRAVGSGHSWSDVALTSGFLLLTTRLRSVLSFSPPLLKPGADARHLVWTHAGIPLRELNDALDRQGLALSNMGGYDAQTVAGVVSTSTHGSGITFGPLCDQVRSLDIVSGGGRVYRVEPSAGITDPAAYTARFPRAQLVQDDDWFHAAQVGMGCLGVIVSAILEVRDAFWLNEVRTLTAWPEAADELRSGKALASSAHYEICFNPYISDKNPSGANRCLITRRDPVAPQPRAPRDKLERNVLVETAASIPFTARLLKRLLDKKPRITPDILDDALEGMVDTYMNKSYKVFNIGAANKIPAYSMEIAVPVERAVDAVEIIMRLAVHRARVADVYHTSPVALRFVKASPAFMSMMHGRDTMMIELIMMAGTEGGFEHLGALEEALREVDGRPHWGQVNGLSGCEETLRALYPRFDDWQRIRVSMDPRGTFESVFTRRVGITRKAHLP